ncbi:hypothetical protein ACFLQY_01610 [Verrucomicrobiota bacterium]
MKTMRAIEHRKGGYALATVLAAVSVSTLLVVGVVKYSMQRCHSVKMIGDRAKAIVYSEAGLDYAYSVLRKDFSKRYDGSFPKADYGIGSYDITLSNVNSNSVLVTCVGYCGIASNVAAISVRNYTETVAAEENDDASEAWEYAVFTGGQVSWSGSGTYNGSGTKMHSSQPFVLTGSGQVDADVYSPYQIELKGNACGLDGNATAPAIDGKTQNITGVQSREPVDPIDFPDIDLIPYYQEALAHGQVYDGAPVIPASGTYSPPGGILWVNGPLTLSGQVTINGCVIATGDINSSLSGGMTRYGDYPTLISRDGDVKITSQGDYEGLLYVPNGDFSMSGGGMIAGQIMVAGNMYKSGNSDAFTFINSAPIPPGGSEAEDQDVIGISGWER